MINGSHSASIEAIRLDEQDAARRAIERKQKQEDRTVGFIDYDGNPRSVRINSSLLSVVLHD